MDKSSRNIPDNLAQPARRALEQAGYTALEQLSNVSDSELLQLHGFDHDGLLLLKEALAEAGLTTAAQPQGAPSSPATEGAKTGRSEGKHETGSGDER